jgi:hypothetical protein
MDAAAFIRPIYESPGPEGKGDPTKLLYWYGDLQGDDPVRSLGEFQGTKDEAIAWAKESDATLRFIYNEELQDFVALQ